jgi:WS/DGAT/MGAT family acyltransferase
MGCLVSHSERLSSTDALNIYGENATFNSHVVGIFRFDGPIPFDDYVADFSHRLPKIPRFRQVVTPVPLLLGHPTWEPDPNFQLDNHLHEIQFTPETAEAELKTLVDSMFQDPISFKKPPWDIYLVNGLENGESAVVMRLHHCLTDGTGALKIFTAIFDFEETPFKEEAIDAGPLTSDPIPGAMHRMTRAIADGVRYRTGAMARWPKALVEWVRNPDIERRKKRREAKAVNKRWAKVPVLRYPWNAPCCGRVKHDWIQLDLEAVRKVRVEGGGTVNDVLLTVYAGAVKKFAVARGQDTAGKFYRVQMPLNMRAHGDHGEWGNYVTLMPALLPLDITDPVEQLRFVAAFTQDAKEAETGLKFHETIYLLQRILPPQLQKAAVRLFVWNLLPVLERAIGRPPKPNSYLTNVRWPDVSGYLGGRRLIGLYPMSDVAPGGAMELAAVNLENRLNVVISVDHDAMTDLPEFMRYLKESFAELCEAANVTPAQT